MPLYLTSANSSSETGRGEELLALGRPRVGGEIRQVAARGSGRADNYCLVATFASDG
jgi:hypothetical protein